MGLRTAIPAFVLLLGQCLQAAASPLVIGEKSVFDQEFLTNFPPPSEFLPNPIQNTDPSDVVLPAQHSHAELTTYPSRFDSALMARRLLALSKTGVASTVFPDPLPPNSHAPPSVAGISIPLIEYLADCDEFLPSSNGGDGNPTFLALYVGTTFRNTAAGSNISLSIDWWDHLDDTKPIYPGFPLSPAGLPRVTLMGYVEPFPTPVTADTADALEKCFFDAHPDAEAWSPSNKDSPHASYWARMIVTQAYWVGGFGDVQRIGWMNMTEWKGIRRESSLPGIGDGRGWDDIRLPGEKE